MINKKLKGLFKGLKISEEEIERARNFGDSIRQGYTQECQHNWIWYPDESSTWKGAGYWRCIGCELFKFLKKVINKNKDI